MMQQQSYVQRHSWTERRSSPRSSKACDNFSEGANALQDSVSLDEKKTRFACGSLASLDDRIDANELDVHMHSF